jgi:hypothetical protein
VLAASAPGQTEAFRALHETCAGLPVAPLLAAAAHCAGDAAPPTRVLFIGNSFTYGPPPTGAGSPAGAVL